MRDSTREKFKLTEWSQMDASKPFAEKLLRLGWGAVIGWGMFGAAALLNAIGPYVR